MKKSLLAAVALLLTSCAGSSVIRLGTRQYPAKPPGCDVEVLTAKPHDRKVEELCIISARGGQSILDSTSMESLIPDMKAQACSCGADALVLKHGTEGSYGYRTVHAARASGVAIRFVEQ